MIIVRPVFLCSSPHLLRIRFREGTSNITPSTERFSNFLQVKSFSDDCTNKSMPGDYTADTKDKKPSSFADAFKKFSEPAKEKPRQEDAFASLLRNSKFIDLGDPIGKKVIGKIYHVVNDDLYIDFGWKFYCVCTRPPTNESKFTQFTQECIETFQRCLLEFLGHFLLTPNNPDAYVRGAEVLLKIKDLELSTRFLGHEKDLTILEADAILLGLVSTPAKNVTTSNQ